MAPRMSLNLQPKQGQVQKQNQLLMMLPRMQQAIQLLQLPIMELQKIIDQEMELNPLLEYSEDPVIPAADVEEYEDVEDIQGFETQNLATDVVFEQQDFEVLKKLGDEYRDFFTQTENPYLRKTAEDDKRKMYFENSIQATKSLFQYLMEQAQETFELPEELSLAESLIGNFDERGYLKTPLEEISIFHQADKEKLLEVLKIIQTFDPPGVGARDLRESLLIQLQGLGKRTTLAYKIIELGFDDLLKNRLPALEIQFNCTIEEIKQAIDKDIARLDLRPGFEFSQTESQPIIPDVSIRQEGQELHVEVNDDSLPPLKLSPRYLKLLDKKEMENETKSYIKQHVLSAKWLIRNILQRNDTLYKIVHFLSVKQKQFFLNPDGQLVPLTMKEVADELELHESTIARAVAHKYLNCGRGLLPLRSFFTNSYTTAEGNDISSQTVREALRRIIDKEDKHRPFSDEVLSKKLKDEGILCARRTVAKYRQEQNIGNTLQRRQYR